MSQFESLCVLLSVLTLVVQAIGVLHPIMRDLQRLMADRSGGLEEYDETES
jgi:hypothetical protein